MAEILGANFLQVAIGTKLKMPYKISDTDWLDLFIFCQRQALIGVGFRAVEILHKEGVECPLILKMKWMALTLKIENKNAQINEQCKKLTEICGHDGLKCCILKGQGNLQNYPEELKLRRNPGDIDVWCVSPKRGRNAVIDYVRTLCDAKPIIRYHHIEGPDFDGTPIEVHFRVGYLNSPLRNKKMQRWFNDCAEMCMSNRTQMGFSIPTLFANVVYLMTHMFRHYFNTGLGLRQLLDYYFTLKAWHDYHLKFDNDGMSVHNEKVMKTLRSFGMGKFAAAVMWVLHEVFAMPAHYYICEPNEKEGRKLLAEIIQGGNFGQYDDRGKDMRNGGTISHAIWKLKRVMRLVGCYPEEALCEPFFRVYQLIWRYLH